MAKKKTVVPIKLEAGRIPTYSTEDSSGADVYACNQETVMIQPKYIASIPLGFKTAIPIGLTGFIVPRSGLARKHGISIINTPGTIDADYRGEWQVLLVNHGNVVFEVNPGDRIGQVVFVKTEQVEFSPVEELDETARGEGGFGHTGK